MKKVVIILFLIVYYPLLQAQTIIKGKVLDTDNQPLVGANIYLKNTFEGCTANENGEFEFTTELLDTQLVVISFLGYKPFEQAVYLNNRAVELSTILDKDNTQLNEVTITVGQFEAGDEKKSMLLGRLDVSSSTNSSFDIYGAFNLLPGTSNTPDEGGLLVRGGEQYETKTFVDGLLVESPFTAKMPNVPVRGRFSPMLFKGFVFNTGGYSAEYGQALSSALILNSVAIPEKSETSFALYSCDIQFSTTQKWNKTAFTSISDYSNLKPYYSLVNSSIDWEREPENLSQTIVFRQKISSTGLLKILGSYIYENSALYYPNYTTWSTDLFSLKKHNLFVIASYLDQLGEKWILNTGISFNVDNILTGIGIDNMEENKNANEYKFTLSNELTGKFKIRFGGNFFNKRYERYYSDIQDDIEYNWSVKSAILASFAETDLSLGRRIALRTGLRYEHLSLNNKNYLAPRISVAYKLLANTQLSFAYGTFTQLPEDEFLLYNKNLDPERAEHFIANFQITRSGRIFRIEAYHKNYKQLVKYDSLYAIVPEAYNNLGSGYARGIDVFYKDGKIISDGDFWISYSFMDTKRNYQDFQTSLTPVFVAKHNLSVQYKHYFTKLDAYAGFTYTFNSGRPYINPNISFTEQQYTRPYHNLSFNLFHFTKLFDKFFMIHFQVGNVLGTEHVFGYNYSTHPNAEGMYQSWPIKSVTKRFFLLGFYLNLKGQPDM